MGGEPDRRDGKRIILFRTDRLGDLVLSLPAVEALWTAWPEARIDLVVSPYTVPVAQLQPHVHRVIPDRFRGARGILDLVRLLRVEGYDLAIHLFPLPRLALASFLARVPVRVGTLYRYFSPLFNRRVRLRRRRSGLHERDLNLRLIEALDVPVAGVEAGIRVPGSLRGEVLGLLEAEGIDPREGAFVVLHPGSGGSSLNWPPGHFAALAGGLRSKGIPVVLTGAEGDRGIVEEVKAGVGGRVTDLCGRLDLQRLAALLEAAALVVSNSTGPLHLADALGTRVIGIYSPFLSAAPARWGPYGQPENAFVPEGPLCPRCTKEACPKYNCLSSIRPDQVLERALVLLQGKG